MADCLGASASGVSAGRSAHREAWGHHPEQRTARRARSWSTMASGWHGDTAGGDTWRVSRVYVEAIVIGA